MANKLNLANIGSVVGYLTPLAATYVVTSEFGAHPIRGAVFAAVTWTMGAIIGKASVDVPNPVCMYTAARGYEYGAKLENRLENTTIPSRGWPHECIRDTEVEDYLNYVRSRPPVHERMRGTWP